MANFAQTIIKKVDRTLHKNDYERLKDSLNQERAQIRSLKPEVEELQLKLSSLKNSPQAPGIELQLRAKQKELQYSQDKLNMLNQEGRKELNTDVDSYKIQKAQNEAHNQGFNVGSSIGGALGLGIGGTAVHTIHAMQEAQENISFEKRILEEAFRPSYSPGVRDALKKAGDYLPSKLGGDAARIASAQIGQNRAKLFGSTRDSLRQGNRPEAAAKIIRTSPHATVRNHPMYEKMQSGNIFREPMNHGEILDTIKANPDLAGTPKQGPLGKMARGYKKEAINSVEKYAQNTIKPGLDTVRNNIVQNVDSTTAATKDLYSNIAKKVKQHIQQRGV